jgi:glycerol-3-phosphate dehydrogenase
VVTNNAANLPVAESTASHIIGSTHGATDTDLNLVHRYYWLGTKCYDLLAGAENIESSYFLTRSKALEAFPMLKKNGLVGALVYYGQSDIPNIIYA